MPAVALLVLLSLALSHWLLEPLLRLATPVFDLGWLGWALLAVIVWLFAGA